MTEERDLSYAAPCPGCRGDACWHALVSTGEDEHGLARTRLDYRIDCLTCGPQAATPRRAVPTYHRGVSSAGWLGRSA